MNEILGNSIQDMDSKLRELEANVTSIPLGAGATVTNITNIPSGLKFGGEEREWP